MGGVAEIRGLLSDWTLDKMTTTGVADTDARAFIGSGHPNGEYFPVHSGLPGD